MVYNVRLKTSVVARVFGFVFHNKLGKYFVLPLYYPVGIFLCLYFIVMLGKFFVIYGIVNCIFVYFYLVQKGYYPLLGSNFVVYNVSLHYSVVDFYHLVIVFKVGILRIG